MDRRESLRTLLIGTVAGASLTTISSCSPDGKESAPSDMAEEALYGRTPAEIAHDEKVMAEVYFSESELGTIATLCDIILPATATAVSATEAKVPEFIEFIAKDLPSYKLPLRGGLMWLDTESNARFGKSFDNCTSADRIKIIDDIAYPDPDGKKPDMAPGIKFFNTIRNLVVTGYYTSKEGMKDLGYAGNQPNVWDGIPEDVLKKHGMEYDPEWIARCVDQEKRGVIAEWDDEGNLLT